ncbi:hypothetical protein DESHY_20015 [Desulforamulus hydrothermalis Lam5 = DSM 18033]|uniref:Uncharacterized protein n=1 Tax=Desulforamulus hydrothermalis Lam5 = DSM 18033 TaxID=1121428 RepID=K8EHN3_9FIRM|nr:hypothetical protein DESHY_20015 [Desulforamulus hydrothermalis Lam5 = DSM 18033]
MRGEFFDKIQQQKTSSQANGLSKKDPVTARPGFKFSGLLNNSVSENAKNFYQRRNVL